MIRTLLLSSGAFAYTAAIALGFGLLFANLRGFGFDPEDMAQAAVVSFLFALVAFPFFVFVLWHMAKHRRWHWLVGSFVLPLPLLYFWRHLRNAVAPSRH